MLIYISGVHSGPSPAPGVGIARCLRMAYPQARLVAVDYSALSTGLNWPEFDGFRHFPAWDQVDFRGHAVIVLDLVTRGALWLAASDREVRWLASALPHTSRIPSPPAPALAAIEKPARRAASLLGIPIPPWASIDDEWALHSFCRRSGWDHWVKGVRGDAVRVRGWPELKAAVKKVTELEGGRDGVFVQCHVEGRGESVAFCAQEGTLLSAVALIKRVATETGKTWTGDLLAIPKDLNEILARFIAETGWSGGGEIEMIRDMRGKLWLMEINPRFPAWIYGAALAGVNLPARLASAVLGIEPVPPVALSRTFTRVVIETPVRNEVATLMDGPST
jgi:diaminopimelate decarboxylase